MSPKGPSRPRIPRYLSFRGRFGLWGWVVVFPFFLFAEQPGTVLKVDRAQKMMAVTHSPGKNWTLDDYLCVSRAGREIACGTVTRITRKGALVVFDFKSNIPVAAGDTIVAHENNKLEAAKAPNSLVRSPSADSAPSPLIARSGAAPAIALSGAAPAVAPGPIVAAPSPKKLPIPSSTPPGEVDTEAALQAVEKGLSAEDVAAVARPPAPPAPPTPSPNSVPAKAADAPVDLDNLDGGTVSTDPVDSSAIGDDPSSPKNADHKNADSGEKRLQPIHKFFSTKPKFRILSDLWLTYRPGIQPPLTFDRYHNLLLFELAPSQSVYFAFEVAPQPRVYELDYKLAKWATLRLGRIYIPFDDLSPHSFFGGRANVSKMLIPGGNPFLPDIWTDLGLGFTFKLADSRRTKITLDVYTVNGFSEGTADPVTSGNPYPDFSGGNGIGDNNSDKALGARVHGKFFSGLIGVGASVYRGTWTNEATTPKSGLMLLGLDGQLQFGQMEIRAGYAYVQVQLPADSFVRGGLYGEISEKFGKFKLLGRVGEVQSDSRATTVNDQIIAGVTALYNFGYVQLSAEWSQDFFKVDGKFNYSFTALRAVFAL